MMNKKSLGAKTLVCPTPVWVIGTYDQAGKANAATAAWVGVCCSNPPAVAVSFTKARHSYGNILARKAFTVNLPSEEYIKEVDYCGIVSGKNEDKFSATGLTAVQSELVDAPYIKEFPLVIECRLLKHHEIGQHTQFIGEIVDVKVDENALGEKGYPELNKIRPILYTPGSGLYFACGSYLGEAYTIGRKKK